MSQSGICTDLDGTILQVISQCGVGKSRKFFGKVMCEFYSYQLLSGALTWPCNCGKTIFCTLRSVVSAVDSKTVYMLLCTVQVGVQR